MEKAMKIYRENYSYLPERFINKIESDLAYLMKADIPGLKKVYLFGSCARGEVRSGSDIDLLIQTEKKLEDRVQAANIRWTLDEEIKGVRTDLVFTHEGAEDLESVFGKTVNRDKKLILEVG